MRTAGFVCAIVLTALSGCAATVNRTAADAAPVKVPAESAKRLVLNMSGGSEVVQSKDWEAFKGEWRGALRTEAAAAGIAFDSQEGEAKPLAAAGTLLVVYVNDYRYVSPGARFGFGIMTGNAFIDARLRYLDLKSGQPLGEQSLNTSSSAWQGIFSAMTDKQVAAIARDIVADLAKSR